MTTLLLSLAIGCAAGPYGAPEGSTIELVSEGQGFVYDMAYADPDDGVGLLIRESVLVMVPGSENYPDMIPGNDILVEITSGYSGAYVIPESAVLTVDGYEEGCEGDASEECRAWFDVATERYVEFSGEYEDIGGFRPTYMSAGTDNRGILDFYVFVDSVASDGETVIGIPLFADIGVDMASWQYDFQN